MAAKDVDNVVLEEKDKASIEQRSPAESIDARPDDDAALLAPEVRKSAERRLVRLLDARLMPTIIIIFIMNYIDRVAITSAKLQGLTQDLNLTGIQYNTVIAVLYASYVPAQIPSNMILNRISRPHYYIPCCVMVWGLVSALTGVTHDFTGIIICRIFLGLPEAAFYPGAMYLLSRWYTRKELAFRGAIIYGGLLVSNAFGSLIAAGILSGMQGKMGIAAWRWLFYIEGAITVCIGLLAMLLLPDYPHNTRWLTPAQRRLAQVRLAEDAGEADEDGAHETAFTGFLLAIKDPKVPIFMVMCCSQLLGLSFVNFFPTIVDTMGYSTTITLLLCVPPWILATITCAANAWHADRTGERFFHHCVPWWGVIVGYIIGVTTMTTAGRYIAIFLMASGYAGFALTAVWVSNAIPRPPAKRSAAIGLVNGFGNIGNLIGSFTWEAQYSPQYHQSMYIGIAALGFATLLSFVIRCMLIQQNKQLNNEEAEALKNPDHRQRIEDAARLEGLTFEEAVQRKKGIRYLY